ncbi:rhomboid family intramembrane serine protease [Porifericola rhodea]|uniref:rhomboid family intramembrane serine protease n=1 Tax=Porifericola rhodea TaxID=930972 RepID=UPI00266580C9|nr:rhomboid family intramembrane serine protease [Porifericola rhodea]WKN31979.1 rhomboid family intramembrane serine protease [Porifericola rhodea]
MQSISKSIIVPARLVMFMWAILLFEYSYQVDFALFGIWPRTIRGLVGIVTAPLLHGGLKHLASNTFPLLFLGTMLYMFYSKIANRVFLQCYFLTGVLVWLFARPAFHIGASGLIYGLASFLIFFGIFRQDFKSLLISLVIMFIYGGLFYGILPTQNGMSWESHLLGGVVGFYNAVTISKSRKVSY